MVRRKAEVITAIRGGLIDLPDAMKRYGLSKEELFAWGAALDRYGLSGLKITDLAQRRRDLRLGRATTTSDRTS